VRQPKAYVEVCKNMDEEWASDIEPENDAGELEVVLLADEESVQFHGYEVYLDGVRITPLDRPDCLKGRMGACWRCVFFMPAACRLRHDPFLVEDLTSILHASRGQYLRWLRRQRALLGAMCRELQSHGRPLHYTVLAQMIAHRFPHVGASESSVLHMLAGHPEKFEKVGEGVYWLALNGRA
jgi:hypothetical protein